MWRTRQRGGTREARRWAPATFDEARLPGSHSRATLFCRSRQTCELFNALLKPRQEPETRVPSSRPLSAPSPLPHLFRNARPSIVQLRAKLCLHIVPVSVKGSGPPRASGIKERHGGVRNFEEQPPPPFHGIKGFRLWWRRAVSSSLISS